VERKRVGRKETVVPSGQTGPKFLYFTVHKPCLEIEFPGKISCFRGWKVFFEHSVPYSQQLPSPAMLLQLPPYNVLTPTRGLAPASAQLSGLPQLPG
jgi:hypothetical protein